MSRSRIITIAVVAVAVIAAVVVAFLLTRPDEATPPEAEMGQVRPVDPARGAAIPEAPFMVIPDELVVLLKEGEDVESFTASLAEEGVTVVGYVPRFRVVQIAVPAERREALRAELANNPTVEAIAHQLLFEAKAALDDPVFTNDDPWDDWGLQAIGAPAAWDITRGSPDVVIAVVDTGMLLSHEEIWAKVIVRPGSVYSEVGAHLGDAEELFHGTHVAVLAVGAGDNGVGTAGVCPDCALMPVQVDLSLSGILAGIAYALDGGAQVINLSLGVDFSEDEIDGFMDPARRDAVIALLEQVREEYLADFDERLAASFASGTTIVVAAGNDAVPGDFDPFCASTFTLCVGNAARREDGTIAPSPTSNYGFMVRVSAPGTDMYSAVAEIGGESYELASGTSMAAPMVAGLAGLILSANPDLAPWEVQEAIMASAHAAAPDSGQGGPPLYATAREPAHELGAWAACVPPAGRQGRCAVARQPGAEFRAVACAGTAEQGVGPAPAGAPGGCAGDSPGGSAGMCGTGVDGRDLLGRALRRRLRPSDRPVRRRPDGAGDCREPSVRIAVRPLLGR